MILTQGERSQIKSILQSPQWATVERLAKVLQEEINASPKIRDSEWETIKATCVDFGMVQGIQKFLQELYEKAQ